MMLSLIHIFRYTVYLLSGVLGTVLGCLLTGQQLTMISMMGFIVLMGTVCLLYTSPKRRCFRAGQGRGRRLYFAAPR